jgi:succinoglycan biosynthesis protein ExoM
MDHSMENHGNHISVCICTYKRPAFLRRLLEDLSNQETGGHFTYSTVICDNDHLRSAEPFVSDFAATSNISVIYCVEPRRGISLARNKAIENAPGNYIALIDDDEFPARNWLHELFAACEKYKVDGVLGPVKPSFGDDVPQWIVKGRFYHKPSHETGFVLAPRNTRTSNVLLRDRVLQNMSSPFRPEFRACEDLDFFTRAIERGYVFVWCDEAVVHEEIPSSRWTRSYLLKKALLRGSSAALMPSTDAFKVTKSFIAVLAYGFTLPFVALLGQHRFMDRLVRLCDHLGMVLAILGFNPIKEPYVTG